MPRRRLLQKNPRQELEAKLQVLTDSSTFRPFGLRLKAFLQSSADEQIVTFVGAQVKKFLTAETDAFWFERLMITSIIAEWSEKLALSTNLIPVYGKPWGYECVALPVIQGCTIVNQPLYFLYVPWLAEEKIPLLLEYPWIFHELGHHVLRSDENVFIESYEPQLEKFLGALELVTLSYQGEADSQARKNRIEIEAYWRPRNTHYDWAHEMAIDVIALWVGGPAYLAAFYEHLRERTDPFDLSQSHPPLALRLNAMRQVAASLGWQDYIGELNMLEAIWHEKHVTPALKNAYSAAARVEIVDACVTAALHYCETSRLPRLTPEKVSETAAKVQTGDAFEGTELIIAAWHVWRTDPDRYDTWEAALVTRIVDKLKQELP